MEKLIKIQSHQEVQDLFGPRDENITLLEKKFKVKVTARSGHLKISGSAVQVKKAQELIETFLSAARSGQRTLNKADFGHFINQGSSAIDPSARVDFREVSVTRLSSGKEVGPRTKGQVEYVAAIKEFDIVFGIGPAGTGKTYLAMACAVEALKKQEVRRIILTRPAVEAGESLGFLPGTMQEKISPYLRPLYDALYDMMEAERIEKYLETGIIEVAPLAYMRGRTLNDAFIVLDEAQNCTAEQMKMFLTRLGFDSKAVITGDMTQSDLPDGRPVGLLQAKDILGVIEGIRFIYFTGFDVVRHPLVQRIIEAYDKTGRDK
ncbi:MAG: PhoH family protein [Candidatus Omnitrophica bacterium]|nr:PhoH family protein [Candidatus Omnitrophota bacterium]